MPCPRFANHADMPELRRDFTAFAVDFLDNTLPTLKGCFPVKLWEIGVICRARTVIDGTLRQDKPNMVRRAALIISRHILPRHTIRRKTPRHRRHNEAIRER